MKYRNSQNITFSWTNVNINNNYVQLCYLVQSISHNNVWLANFPSGFHGIASHTNKTTFQNITKTVNCLRDDLAIESNLICVHLYIYILNAMAKRSWYTTRILFFLPSNCQYTGRYWIVTCYSSAMFGSRRRSFTIMYASFRHIADFMLVCVLIAWPPILISKGFSDHEYNMTAAASDCWLSEKCRNSHFSYYTNSDLFC